LTHPYDGRERDRNMLVNSNKEENIKVH